MRGIGTILLWYPFLLFYSLLLSYVSCLLPARKYSDDLLHCYSYSQAGMSFLYFLRSTVNYSPRVRCYFILMKTA